MIAKKVGIGFYCTTLTHLDCTPSELLFICHLSFHFLTMFLPRPQPRLIPFSRQVMLLVKRNENTATLTANGELPFSHVPPDPYDLPLHTEHHQLQSELGVFHHHTCMRALLDWVFESASE